MVLLKRLMQFKSKNGTVVHDLVVIPFWPAVSGVEEWEGFVS